MEKSRIKRIQRLVKKAAEPCVDLLFPRICPLCGQIVTKEEGLICPKCRPKAEKLLLREPLFPGIGARQKRARRRTGYTRRRAPHPRRAMDRQRTDP